MKSVAGDNRAVSRKKNRKQVDQTCKRSDSHRLTAHLRNVFGGTLDVSEIGLALP